MSRMFYSDYSAHCLKFYARYPHPDLRNKTNKQNWKACKDALDKLSKKDRERILEVYRDNDTLADAIYNVAERTGTPQDTLWTQVACIEREVAKNRGLL